ncbi:hypothetical protein BH20ACI4_BH20ACI4_26020 [soil metagenome]
MKTKFILALILTLAFGGLTMIEAQTRQQQKIQINKQKKFSRSNLTVKFVSLIEDSRCPIGTNCIWAGNAKIKIEVGKGRNKKTFEVNTNLGPKGADYDGYQIELVSLTPEPRENIRINKNGYVATFAVSRLTR